MQTITFTCEVITPMFLAGADGTTPELRPASIKGALRFWWRAINGHLSIDEMRKIEGEIFGSTEKRSKVIILPVKIISEKDTKISNTPHHTKEYCKIYCEPQLRPNQKCPKSIRRDAKYYEFELKIKFESSLVASKNIEDLIKCVFLLGGIGKRVRRGFGSIMIRKINNIEVFSTFEEIRFFLGGIKEIIGGSNFGYVKKVEIGKAFNSDSDVLEAIGLASHNNSSKWLGFAEGKKRFSSPIYVSVIQDEYKKYYPIITTLNTATENTISATNTQSNFINVLK